MTALLTALGSGISAKKILEYLMRKSPELAPRITKALASGLSAEKIIGFFSKDQNFEKLKSEMEQDYPMKNNANPLVQAQNVRSQNLGSDMASGLQRAAPGILAGAGALGAGMALKHAIPTILQGGQSQTSPQTTPIGTQSQTPIIPQTSQPPVNAPNIPQNAPTIQPQVISNPKEYLEKRGVLEKVKDLLKRGNTPEQAAAALSIKDTSGKARANADPELISNIEEYAKQKLTTENLPKPNELVEEKLSTTVPTEKIEKFALPDETWIDVQKRYGINMGEAKKLISERDRGKFGESEENKQKISEIPQDQDKFSTKLEKRSFVKTPKGVGEIKEIRNGQALVDVDNKIQKFKEEELQGSPFTEDDIADAYENVMAKTPEAHKSSWVQWAGYDENTNTLGFIPRGGKYEELTDITPEEALMIKEGRGTARTSGEEREGLWLVGEGTKGGLVSQILHERKTKRKESEERQGKFSFVEELEKPEKQELGMKPIFEEMAFSRGLSKERERKKKLEERERKKREKEKRKK